jgi:hypothetical protein
MLLDFATPTGKTEDGVGFVTYKIRNVTIKALSRMEKLLALKFKSEMLQHRMYVVQGLVKELR